MRIVHLALSSTYNEEFSYQENLLPRAQVEKGDCVFVIARNQRMENKQAVYCSECYKTLDDGVTLIRVKTNIKKINSFSHPSKSTIMNLLILLQPDFIWVHSLINKSLSFAVNYKRHYNNNCIIVADNHLDCHNIHLTFVRRFFLFVNSLRNKHLSKYVELFYGVTPGRKDFMVKYLGAPIEKSNVCIMGIDDQSLCLAKKNIESFRKDLGISEDKFVIVTGGKIDSDKKTIELIQTILLMKNKNVILVIFGSVDKKIKNVFYDLIDNNNIVYLGWKNQEEINKIFLISNLGIFLNSHSVLWENACACGLPCVFGIKDGFEHLFQFNNSLFHPLNTCEEYAHFLDNLINSKTYDALLTNSQLHCQEYMYSKIVDNIKNDIKKRRLLS